MNAFMDNNHINFILVFLEGIISFFSPCVIPLIPVYMGFLAGNGKIVDESGQVTYNQKKVFLHTIFFVLGISFAFFILGMSFTALGSFFQSNKVLFTRIGGILIILLGLVQLGILDFEFFQKERKIHIDLRDKEVNPIMALIMGFTFSFAWTPCVGPALSSVLIMASGAKTSNMGNLLVLVYALGFVIPFLFLGLFTTQVLEFLKTKKKLLKYTIKAGGIILIIMGIMIFTGWMNGVSSYLNSFQLDSKSSTQEVEDIDTNEDSDQEETTAQEDATQEKTDVQEGATQEERKEVSSIDFTLTDQYGNKHTLSEYKGKVVFLNFWATWCPPCKEEMPHIEKLYKEYGLNEDEVIFLGVANPKNKEYPRNQDVQKDEVISFLEENQYTFPTVFDETGEIFQSYGISAFPTTFMIDKKGNIYGYVPGGMTKDIMRNIITETLETK